MAEHGQFFQFRMNHAQAFLITSEISPAAGIKQERTFKSLGVTSMTSGLDRGMFAIRFEFGYSPPFPNLGSRGAAMFQQQIVENRTFDLKCFCLAREAAIAKNQLQRFAGIAEVKLGAKLLRKSRCFESCQHAHFLEEPAIVGQQRLSNVKSGKMLFLKHQDPLACARQQAGRGAASRPSSNH